MILSLDIVHVLRDGEVSLVKMVRTSLDLSQSLAGCPPTPTLSFSLSLSLSLSLFLPIFLWSLQFHPHMPACFVSSLSIYMKSLNFNVRPFAYVTSMCAYDPEATIIRLALPVTFNVSAALFYQCTDAYATYGNWPLEMWKLCVHVSRNCRSLCTRHSLTLVVLYFGLQNVPLGRSASSACHHASVRITGHVTM